VSAAWYSTSVIHQDARYHPDPKFLPYPSKHVSIRGVQDETYCAIDITKLGQLDGQARILEEVETGRALFELYEGAIVSRTLLSLFLF
jgi:DEAD/DEAH box helicase domain-containing protein